MTSASSRTCSRVSCRAAATMTLTYNYSESLATLRPIATFAEPHTYDLCQRHAASLTVPHGWSFVKETINESVIGPSEDDLMAIADAVREAANLPQTPTVPVADTAASIGRRGHLRAVPN